MKLVKAKLGNRDFWYRADDKYVGQRIALGKYEEFETKIFLENVDKNSVVVDVGANIGYYTLLSALKAKKVYAVEPDKECFEILKKNIRENNLKNVVLLNVAASDKKEVKFLVRDEDNLGNSHLDEKNGVKVKCERLDEILKNEQYISSLKIDVQGWEPAVVVGAKKTIEKFRPVIFLEYTPSEYKDDKMINFLRKLYPRIWQINYWYYIYKLTGKKIEVDKKTGYADLWMKKDNSWKDWIRGYKNVQIKKVIKRLIQW